MLSASGSIGRKRLRETFGEFISRKRKEKGLTLQLAASQLGITVSYLSDIEHDRRYPPEERLPRIASVLGLKGEETTKMYDLAAVSRETSPADLSEYLMKHPTARKAVRYARDNDFSDSDWELVLHLFQDDENNRKL